MLKIEKNKTQTNCTLPQQNGVTERMNRILVESTRAMIAHAALPNNYWEEAIATAAYIRNRAPTTAIKPNTFKWIKFGFFPYHFSYGVTSSLNSLCSHTRLTVMKVG